MASLPLLVVVPLEPKGGEEVTELSTRPLVNEYSVVVLVPKELIGQFLAPDCQDSTTEPSWNSVQFSSSLSRVQLFVTP